MKRLTYISNFSRPLSAAEIESIGAVSIRNNSRDGLTGALFTFREIFYQILEGEEGAVEECYRRIRGDDRHQNIFCVKMENDITARMYPDWSMKTVVLDEQNDPLVRPIRNLMNAMATSFRHLEKYTPAPILDAIQHGVDPNEMTPLRSERIVLFSDIVGSTTVIEKASPADITRFLSAYYEAATEAIHENGGEILKLTGDGLMANFERSQANRSIEAALGMVRRMRQVREQAGPDDILRGLYTGIGITAGSVLAGNIGSRIFKDYTLIGDVVNTAARLESVTRKIGRALVFDEAIAQDLDARWGARSIGVYRPKGKSEQIRIYSIMDPVLDLPPRQLPLA